MMTPELPESDQNFNKHKQVSRVGELRREKMIKQKQEGKHLDTHQTVPPVGPGAKK